MIGRTKRDFATLATERLAAEGLAAVQGSAPAARADVLARVLLDVFDDYYTRSRRIPWLAKRAFEARAWAEAIDLSQERIAIFSLAIAKAMPILGPSLSEADRTPGFWATLETRYTALVSARYEADLALAFLASVRRWLHRNAWTPIPYDFASPRAQAQAEDLTLSLWPPGQMTAEIVREILAVPALEAPFRDLSGDAEAVAQRINAELGLDQSPGLDRIEVIRAGFYRNRGAYVVGALEMQGQLSPLALALEHGREGIYVNAVILREASLSHIFSSTLANFHVTETRYHELVDLLHTLMPSRARGLHYSTIGYNHVGKMAVMAQVKGDLAQHQTRLDHAPGPRGSVAIGFTAETASIKAGGYIAKVIRDTPTPSYKWAHWGGVASVLEK
ncbi:MAG: isocitrate dehydrogenase kinase/phosphatase AceK regulatory subunit, partial [Pseudomonadota bacterium]